MTAIVARAMMALLISTVCFAKSGMIERGGLGFIYTDNNSFANPANFGEVKGFSIDGKYTTANSNASLGATASAVYGTGSFGIGAYDNRSGSSLTSTGFFSDSAGVGLGVGLMHGKVLVGAGYRQTVSGTAADTGGVNASVTVKNEKGISFGVAGSQQLGSVSGTNKQTATAGVGFAASNGIMTELAMTLNNIAEMSNYTAGAFLTKGGQNAYVGLGYYYDSLGNGGSGVATHTGAARLGVILGRSFDMSIFAQYTFVAGATPAYGATIRYAL
ncbi:MAG: hypothetical protein HYR96_11815 [Deltaproteobacteria bacterium]|nr:hypothetical protein [Deltaproteobacteria bacterium]MBI3293711.1 hypothetical protein [Deltaproteobacteria bacterium]